MPGSATTRSPAGICSRSTEVRVSVCILDIGSPRTLACRLVGSGVFLSILVRFRVRLARGGRFQRGCQTGGRRRYSFGGDVVDIATGVRRCLTGYRDEVGSPPCSRGRFSWRHFSTAPAPPPGPAAHRGG